MTLSALRACLVLGACAIVALGIPAVPAPIAFVALAAAAALALVAGLRGRRQPALVAAAGLAGPAAWAIGGGGLHPELTIGAGSLLALAAAARAGDADAADQAKRELETRLLHQARHDPLTGLANRAHFSDRVEDAFTRGARQGWSTGVLAIDLDGFKAINESLGHAVGDLLLREAGGRIRGCLRRGDVAGRLGADEFGVLLHDLRERGDAVRLGERIMAALRVPFVLEGEEVFLSAGAGIAFGRLGREGAEDVLRNAGIALHAAKARGKAFIELFEDDMHASARRRLELEAELRRAIEREELELHYQPLVDLETGRITGVESLVRWRHPERGLVSPADFIPIAEETGLILPLGTWVLREACRQARIWQQRYPSDPPLAVSVNLSGRQVHQPGVVELVRGVLDEEGLDPRTLIIEITESVMMQDTEATIAKLERLHGLGVRLAVDDFGTGYSSLSYLRRFPVDMLKIAKPFTDELAGEVRGGALAGGIVELGQTLGLDVIAEGIERADQRDRLAALRCAKGQGYFFAKPMEARAIESVLALGRITEGTDAEPVAVEPVPLPPRMTYRGAQIGDDDRGTALPARERRAGGARLSYRGATVLA